MDEIAADLVSIEQRLTALEFSIEALRDGLNQLIYVLNQRYEPEP